MLFCALSTVAGQVSTIRIFCTVSACAIAENFLYSDMLLIARRISATLNSFGIRGCIS